MEARQPFVRECVRELPAVASQSLALPLFVSETLREMCF